MNRNLYKFVLDGIKDGVYFVDIDRKIDFWNKGAEALTGFKKEDVVGHHCYDNILNHVDDEGHHLCNDGCPLHATLQDGIERKASVYFQHKDGHRVKTDVYIMPIFEQGKIIGAVETFNADVDETVLKKYVEELKVLAFRDQLTGLPNRRFLDNELEIAIRALDNVLASFAIAIVDVDHFKHFNDTYGHDVGDEVLQMLGKVLRAGARASDVVGRWGGEEFMLILKNVNEQKMMEVMERFRMLIEHSALRSYKPALKVTVSIGGSIYKAGEDIEETFKRADQALYHSKESGRNQVSVR